MENVSAELIDITGRTVLTIDTRAKGSKLEFDTQSLPRGLYYLRIVENYDIKAIKIILE